MRAKKAKKSARSIRYLLSADRALGKISLRRISERLKKAAQPLRSTRSKHARTARSSAHSRWPISPRALVLVASCIVAAVALATARQPSPEMMAVGTALADAQASIERASVAAHRPASDIVLPTEPVRSAAARKTARASVVQPRPAEPLPVSAVEAAVPPAAVPIVVSRTSEPAPAGLSEPLVPVTIIGCLELNKDTFQLKDTSGADAPKSRSWKSGFLRKRPSAIALVEPAGTLRLSDHIGERVSVTGTLVDREMRARTLRRVAASCD